jgi:anti-sigma28 factor (negative regulator of flagellin synthesis)
MLPALEAADAAADVRAARVADARQRIAQGTYVVRAEVIARGILEAWA